MRPAARRFALRAGVSLAILVGLGWLLDPGSVLRRLAALDPAWVVVGLVLSTLQVGGSAWRWRFTAGRLGIRLPWGVALREYYLATFLNQVLPGGVVGDVSRAWRHARDAGGEGDDPSPPDLRLRAVNAVVLERLSGQAVMTLVAVTSAAYLLTDPAIRATAGSLLSELPSTSALLLLGAVGLLGVMGLLVRRIRRLPVAERFGADARAALLRGSAFPVQLLTSLAVVASYLVVYLVAARSIGIETPVAVLLPLVGPVLVAMLLPVSVAGWGVREGVAAGLWGLAGLTATDGVAISVAYGLLVLASSLPGALILAVTLARRRGPRRRGDPSPG